MRVTAYTTKEQLLNELQNIQVTDNKIKVIVMADEHGALFQLIGKRIEMNVIFDLGIVQYNPAFLADANELKITFLINK